MNDAPTTTEQSKIEAFVTEHNDKRVIETRCRQCQVQLWLDYDVELSEAAEKNLLLFGGLIVCDSCMVHVEERESRILTKQQLGKRLFDSGLPRTMHNFAFDDMHQDGNRRIIAIAAAKDWAEIKKPRGLVLFGDVGVGKTRLAATAALQRMRSWSLTWVSVPILLAQIGSSFGTEDRAYAVSVLTGKGPLVLDDLDKVNPSEWARNHLFAAIDSRIQAGTALLVTTNLSPNRLADKLGDPIASRLAGNCDVYQMEGSDRRLDV